MNFLIRPTVIAVSWLILASGAVNADCMKDRSGDVICGKGECLHDRYGVVYCSAFRKGSAIRTSFGNIVCGKGHCVKDRYGEVFCSTEPEGDAVKNRYGEPRCEGLCERASADYCEMTSAGW